MRIRLTRIVAVLAVFWLSGIVPHRVGAQEIDPTRFTPLGPGDRWEYRIEQVRGADAPAAFLRFEIEPADTVVEERSFSVLRVRAFDVDMHPTFVRRCAFRRAEEAGRWPEILRLGGDDEACDLTLPLPPSDYLTVTGPDTISVGDQAVVVDATAWYGYFLSGPGGSGGGSQHYVALDVGTYRYERETRGRSLPPAGTDHLWVATLTYAEVNGTTYGGEQVTTAAERRPVVDGAPPGIARLYPNPSGRDVRFVTEGLQPGPARAEVFDVTGRRVWTADVALVRGPSTLRPPPGPSGPYLLRITDGAGRRAERLMVRVATQ